MTAEPKLMPFIYVNGKLAGMAIASLDYNFLLKKINGRLFPFGILTLLTQKRTIKWARVILLGLLPEYRGKGLDAVLYHELVARARELGIQYGEGSWILEDNLPINQGMESVNAKIYKKYKVYELPINQTN
jgi:GNAT superfamily N-acetyltransferase